MFRELFSDLGLIGVEVLALFRAGEGHGETLSDERNPKQKKMRLGRVPWYLSRTTLESLLA